MKFLIVGLGNIGAQYRDTRHNIGFMVLDRLVSEKDKTPELVRHAYYAETRFKGRILHLIMPTTYMNLSGKAVRYYMNKYNIPIQNILVITDDVALPFGKLRIRAKGSAGGHNGLGNIQDLLGSNQYPRLRIGVGNDYPKGMQVDYVLSPFKDEEFDALPEILDKCVKAIYSFATIGIDRTMTQFNKK